MVAIKIAIFKKVAKSSKFLLDVLNVPSIVVVWTKKIMLNKKEFPTKSLNVYGFHYILITMYNFIYFSLLGLTRQMEILLKLRHLPDVEASIVNKY